jgi:hypothetical protein
MNLKLFVMLFILVGISFGILFCAVDETESTSDLVQYTPDQANWDTFDTKPFESGTNTSHDPDGVGWLSEESWEKAEWDGTVYDPTTMSADEFFLSLCPSVDQVRGIREVFYKHKPFADNRNPTKAEGFWGGHVGPWFHREKFGFSFWDNDPDNNNNNAVLRAKWSGELLPNKYSNR